MEDPVYEELRERIRHLEQEARDQKLKLLMQENLEEQLIQAQKMESLANLAAGIAHDFNNILQSILGLTQLALFRKTQDAQDLETFQQIEKIVGRGRELTEQFLTLGRRKLPAFAPLDLNRRVRETASLLGRTIPKMIEIELALARDIVEIQADEGQIEQVLMNLSLNARDAMAQGGRLTFTTENVHLEPGDPLLDPQMRPGHYERQSVADTGCGIPAEKIKRIYEPFFTTKPVGKGTGLGLAMVYAIVKNHEGLLHCTSRVGEGTTFSLYFPALSGVRKDPAGVPHTSAEGSGKGSGNETLLLVEDDSEILESTGKLLENYGYRVVTAESGEEAVEIYASEAVDLVVLDVSMPGMGGLKCLEELLTMDRSARIIISTGYPFNAPILKDLKAQTHVFLPKPYAFGELLGVVRNTLDRLPRGWRVAPIQGVPNPGERDPHARMS
jgi:signal transduction histidine kinase